MKRLFPALLLAATSVALMAQSDFPKRKAGLWEVTMTLPSSRTAMPSAKMCIDAATDAELLKTGTSMSRSACSKHEVHVSGKVVTIDAVCTIAANTTSTTHTTTTFTSDTAYHTDAKTHYDPPFMGRSDSTVTQDGKWAGACPADMQPGDMLLPSGVKMNVKNLSGP